jgi:hypothetical protein
VSYQASGGGGSTGDTRPNAEAKILSKPEPELLKDVSIGSQVTIVLEAIFTSDGLVTNVHFVKVTPEDAPKEAVKVFAERAIEAAKRIKFTPARKDGRVVSMRVQLEYNFTPTASEAKPEAKTPEANPTNLKPKV